MPSQKDVDELVACMWQLLDDMHDGCCVSLAAKASARLAFEPFNDFEAPPYMTMMEARKIINETNS